MRKLGLSEAEKSDLEERIREVGKQFGKSHRHAGLGIRDLRAGIYECRSGLDLRLVFVKDASTSLPTIYFDMIGNHDQVKRYLKRK